jgi:hypothetical protein
MLKDGKMKLSTKYTVLFLTVLLLFTGCMKRDLVIDRQQMILFQYDFRSPSQHHGFMIDSEGNVFTYNNPSNWNFPDNDLEISREQVADNTGNCIYSGVKIPENELLKHTKVIDYIASSKVTAPAKKDADEGTAQYLCYQFDKNSQKYTGHLIRSEGKVARENLNFHSKRVALWMKEIGNGLSF